MREGVNMREAFWGPDVSSVLTGRFPATHTHLRMAVSVRILIDTMHCLAPYCCVDHNLP